MKVNPKLQIIAPKWYKKIRKAKSYNELLKVTKSKDDVLDLSQYSCCVVGESHGFSGLYSTQDQDEHREVLNGCVDCTKFAKEIFVKKPTPRLTAKNFQQQIDKYLWHVHTKHGVQVL